jgi:membrane associated rhomboid family serine protease
MESKVKPAADILTIAADVSTIIRQIDGTMIPLRDKNKSRTIPFVNYAIIAVCLLLFLYELSLDARLTSFVHRFAVAPSTVSAAVRGHTFAVTPYVPLVSSMFLHGGWLHLLGNMLYLYIFGDNVEDRLGHGGYLLFYLLCGVGSALVQVYSNPSSSVPLLGASGAIAGVLGAYLILYPRAKILTLIPLGIIFPIVEVSAFFFLGFWFILQLLQAMFLADSTSGGGGIAWWAHFGGFVIGALLLPLFLMYHRLRSWK